MWTPSQSPVDIVYLWVDGNDPVWRQKRQIAVKRLSKTGHSDIAQYGNVEGRFRDNEELRYSLRALERYFPDHGHVYIVTDGQTPAWLKATDRLTIIDHKDLIPASSLPTFDSGNIESYIHRIPELSERYFYFNDDVFFGAPVNLDDWFWSGGIYVGWSDDPLVSDEPLRKDSNSLENACRLSNQWFLSNNYQAYEHTFRTFAHSPRPMLKSLVRKAEIQASDMFKRVRSTTFRVWDKPTVISDFVMRWALAHGMAKTRDYKHAHVSTGDTQANDQLNELILGLDSINFFCINDTTDNALGHDARLVNVKTALQQFFWWPSSFEHRHVMPVNRSRPDIKFPEIAGLAYVNKNQGDPYEHFSPYST
jgi:Stealth protein CR2, conserved region 2/Stealth protein CR1, conserved region 1